MDPWDELLAECKGSALRRPLLLLVIVCFAISILGCAAKAGPDKREAVNSILCCGGR